jgi:hypothetical protein
VDTVTTKPHLLIAIPKLLCFKTLFEQVTESVLDQLGDTDITIISDSKGRGRQILESKGYRPHEIRITTKLDAKSAVNKFSHFLVFWDGDELADIIYFAKLCNKPLRIVSVQITKVRNMDTGQEFDVYIGRNTPWGNPFPIEHGSSDATRKIVVDKFRIYFQQEFLDKPENLKKLKMLRGLRLGCHCKPKECHGDVIANYLNDYFDSVEQDQQIDIPKAISSS